MELKFEYNSIVGQGKFPDFIQFEKTEGEIFYIDNGLLYGKSSERFHGDFSSPVWVDTHELTPAGDTDLSNLELKTLSGFGVVGSYLTPLAQKMIIYEYQQDVSDYLSDGEIRFITDTPIASFNLLLENPKDKEGENGENVAISEKTSLLSPGAKVVFSFMVGDDFQEVELGSFYIDRSEYNLLSESAGVSGRNLIGKALKDQTLNTNNNLAWNTITGIINELMYNANLLTDQYVVETNTDMRSFSFEANTEILGAVEDILTAMVDWRMEESLDGEIIIGSPTFSAFPKRTTYSFRRDKDIFNREIVSDDQGAYRKVCVHTSDWTVTEYKDVQVYSGWNLQSSKTLFVEVAQGTSQISAVEIATEIASRLENVGKVETFDGPFRPQLLVGDGAEIVEADGGTNLGLITEITHSFGKQGFTTSFTVDSGGELGKGRLADYISMIQEKGKVGSISYEDI